MVKATSRRTNHTCKSKGLLIPKVYKEKFNKYVYYHWIQQFVVVPKVVPQAKKSVSRMPNHNLNVLHNIKTINAHQ
jgi:hypothetical protein